MKYVRVVVLSFNSSKYTIATVNMLKGQIYENFEILVVDNGSRESERIILQTELPTDVICLFSEKNLGYAAGNNLGMRYNSGRLIDYFFILNNDVIINDQKLIDSLVQSFNVVSERRILAVSPLVDTISTNVKLENQIQVRRILTTSKLFFVCCAIFKLLTRKWFDQYIYKDKMPFTNSFVICDSINGAAFMIDVAFMNEIGYLDEGTFLFFEEIILGRQILNYGGTCLLNGYASVIHLQGVSSKSTVLNLNKRMEKYKRDSEVYYFRKYCNVNPFFLMFYVVFKKVELQLKRIIY